LVTQAETRGADSLRPLPAVQSTFLVAITILIIAVVGNTAFAFAPLLLSGMSQYLRFDDAFLGSLEGVQAGGGAIATIAAIFFLDRQGWPLRRTALIALTVYALGNALEPVLFDRPGLLTLAFFICGAASGLVWASCATAVTVLPDNSRLIAVFYGTPYATGLAIQPLMPTIFAHWGVGTAFRLMGIAALAGFAVIRWLPARAIGARPQDDRTKATRDSGGRAGLILLSIEIALLLQYLANSGLWVYFDRLGALAGHTSQVSANIVALGGGMSLVGTALAATFAKRLSPATTIVALSLLLALATLALFEANVLILFASVVFVLNASVAVITTSYFILVSRLPVSPGKAALVSNLCMMVGFAVGPIVFGRLADKSDFSVAIFATAALFILSAAIVVAVTRKSG
jgi:predicted MFS family arabinose efflux permease